MKNSFDAAPAETLTDEELGHVQGGELPLGSIPPFIGVRLLETLRRLAYQATAPVYSLPAASPTDARTLTFPE